MDTEPILVFDGICNLCNGAVNLVIRNDKHKMIRFAAFQTDAGRELMRSYHFATNELVSFVFIENNRIYTRSTAALRVCRYLKGGWPLCYIFIIVPRFIRDAVYNLVAKKRYQWFGKTEQCMVPTPEIKNRFL